MKKHWFCRLTALCLSVLLFCAACGNQGANAPGEGETVKSGDDTPVRATTIRMIKTEGTVGVADDAGAQVPVISDMGLYSGYGVDTEEKSYAWINLDDVKLTKMDAESKISIRKEDKSLDVLVEQGSLFFHVTEPLAEDESFTIRSSNTVVGIRGTCGWVTLDASGHLELYLIEGQVEYTYQNPDTGADDTSTVQAGQKLMLLEDCDGTFYIEVIDFWPEEVPLFVGIEGMENETLLEWMEAYGMTPDDFLAMAGGSGAEETAEPMAAGHRDVIITGTQVGATDCSTPFWTEFSEVVAVPGGESVTVNFKNYSSQRENWNNFSVILQNVPEVHSFTANADYKEYAVVRADNYGWGTGYENIATSACNWNWNTFKADMDGADVELTITNNGETADIVAKVTSAAGTTYTQSYTGIAVDGDLYYCLTVDGSFIDIQESQEPEVSDPKILTMPITSDELFNVVWDQKNTDIIVQSDGEETTLELNFIDISEGQTLTFEEGINIRVVYPQDYDSNFEKGATLMIRGTMIVNGDLTNEGMISISGGRLEVNGDVQNPSGSEISLERHPNYPENVPTLIVTGVLHNQGAFYNYGNGTIEATVE